MNEALRQQGLLAAIWAGGQAAGLREAGERARQGIAAYRGNADAVAERALAATFPTLQQMLGAEDFAHLAAGYRRADPPKRGDLGEWGGGLPGWIEAQADLAEWPWLADTARLELAIHHAERAADAEFDAGSLEILAQHDPGRLRLVPMPGLALVRSVWPIVTIHAAHRAPDAQRAEAFSSVREAIAQRRGEAAVIHRDGWRAAVQGVADADAAFVAAMLEDASLAHALVQAGEGFDFGAFLALAIGKRWLKGVSADAD
jgi:hypothetical protein